MDCFLLLVGDLIILQTYFSRNVLVPLLERGEQEKVLALLRRLGAILEKEQARAHLFGIGNAYILTQVARMSWFASADSSAWLMALRAREVLLASGEQRNASALGLRLPSSMLAVNNIRVMQEWIDPSAPHQLSFAAFSPAWG
jgi:hypothetical protein